MESVSAGDAKKKKNDSKEMIPKKAKMKREKEIPILNTWKSKLDCVLIWNQTNIILT